MLDIIPYSAPRNYGYTAYPRIILKNTSDPEFWYWMPCFDSEDDFIMTACPIIRPRTLLEILDRVRELHFVGGGGAETWRENALSGESIVFGPPLRKYWSVPAGYEGF